MVAGFAPLRDLHLHPETELYLGLVHYTDGVEGARKRIETARRFAFTRVCSHGAISNKVKW